MTPSTEAELHPWCGLENSNMTQGLGPREVLLFLGPLTKESTHMKDLGSYGKTK